MVHGEFQAGSALGRGFGIWLKNLPAFLVMTTLVYTPVIIYTAVVLNGPLTLERLATMEMVSALLTTILNLLVTAAVLYGVIQQLRGEHAGIGQCVGAGLKRLFPVLGVGLVSILPLLLVGVVAVFAPALILVLLIPMVIYYIMIYVAIPAAVVERPGVIGALKRSVELTRGYKLQIFGIVLILGLLALAIGYVMQSALIEDTVHLSQRTTFYWVDLIVSIALTSLSASINGVVYHDLRVAKEGVATEDLAKVFE